MIGSLDKPNDLLLGRQTHDIFPGLSAHVPADSPFGPAFTKANKNMC